MKSTKVMQKLNDLSQAPIEFHLNHFLSIIQVLNWKPIASPAKWRLVLETSFA